MYHNHFTTILVILGNSLLLDYCFSWISRTFFLAEGGIFIAPFTTEFANTKLLRVHSFFVVLGAWSWPSKETGASGAFIWIEIWEEWRMEAWEEGNSRPFPGSDTGGGRWCVGCYVRHLPHLHLKLGGERLDALWFVNDTCHPSE